MRPAAALLLLLPLVGACVTEVHRRPAPATVGAVRTAHPSRAWQVVEAGVSLGTVVFYDADGHPSESFYGVRNPLRHELGMIDSLGMAWRYRPHEREAEWVSTGTVREGALAILGASEDGSLREIPLDTVAPPGPATAPP